MISKEVREKRQMAYEITMAKTRERGIELTPETQVLMNRFINGEIGEKDFFMDFSTLIGKSFQTQDILI